jgi:hypothetical protein
VASCVFWRITGDLRPYVFTQFFPAVVDGGDAEGTKGVLSGARRESREPGREDAMFVGHYGVSFGARRSGAHIPLWVLFIAVQLLDIAWAPLVLLGIEKVRIVPGYTATNPLDLYYMPYTHSLTAALLWSAGAFFLYRLVRGREGAMAAFIVAAAVFSHWILDFIVHKPDLPLYDNTAKVGLGLWDHAALAFGLEAAVLFGGIWLYSGVSGARRAAAIVLGVVMLAIQAWLFFGPPPDSDKAAAASAIVAYALFAGAAAVLERRRRTPVL